MPFRSRPSPVPDGAIMVKEMFPPPAAACASVDPLHLMPTSGAAIMVRDAGRLPRRLVLGLVRMGREGLAAGLAGARGQRLSVYGLRPLLHELPRLGARQRDLRVAAQHQGRARRSAGVPQPDLRQRRRCSRAFTRQIAKVEARHGAAARPALPVAVHALLPAPEQGAADQRHRRQACRRKPTTMSGRRPASRTRERKW